MTDERIELQRPIPAAAADIFKIVSDPAGHVAIDATGMLQSLHGRAGHQGRRRVRDPHGP